jgi:hypothetical protein
MRDNPAYPNECLVLHSMWTVAGLLEIGTSRAVQHLHFSRGHRSALPFTEHTRKHHLILSGPPPSPLRRRSLSPTSGTNLYPVATRIYSLARRAGFPLRQLRHANDRALSLSNSHTLMLACVPA